MYSFIVPDHINYSPSYSYGPPGSTMTRLQTFKNGPSANASNPLPAVPIPRHFLIFFFKNKKIPGQ